MKQRCIFVFALALAACTPWGMLEDEGRRTGRSPCLDQARNDGTRVSATCDVGVSVNGIDKGIAHFEYLIDAARGCDEYQGETELGADEVRVRLDESTGRTSLEASTGEFSLTPGIHEDEILVSSVQPGGERIEDSVLCPGLDQFIKQLQINNGEAPEPICEDDPTTDEEITGTFSCPDLPAHVSADPVVKELVASAQRYELGLALTLAEELDTISREQGVPEKGGVIAMAFTIASIIKIAVDAAADIDHTWEDRHTYTYDSQP